MCSMMLADLHAHLDIIKEEKLDGLVDRAKKAGVKAIITAGVDKKSNRKCLELQEQFYIVKASLGLYPTEASKLSDSEIGEELAFIRGNKDKIVGIGEIGLDYQEAEDDDEKEKQQILFEKQLELAKILDIPAIVHSRKAEKEVVETLIKLDCKKVVLHAFHGKINLVKEAIEKGFYFSIPTNIVRSSQFQAIVKAVNASNLLTETDSPFLATEKDGKSEPAHITETISEIAKIKGLEQEETANIIYSSYQKLFA
jgi:TatD DNase family protein